MRNMAYHVPNVPVASAVSQHISNYGNALSYRVREARHQRGPRRRVLAAISDALNKSGSADRGGMAARDIAAETGVIDECRNGGAIRMDRRHTV